jgi:hypothetical protein
MGLVFWKVLDYAVRVSSIETMTVQKVYAHILNDSAWAWRKLGSGINKDELPHMVRAEMRRAGKDGEVRYFGSIPNTVQDVNVSAAYWDRAYFSAISFDNADSVPHTVIESSDNTTPDTRVLNIRLAQVDKVEIAWPKISWAEKKWIELKIWHQNKTKKSVTTS